MRLRRVAILGGGPGGLYAARLFRLADPDCVVDVYEQGRPDTTFGFGVGLAAGTQRNLRAADPASLDDIVGRSHRHDIVLRVGDHTARMTNDNLRAIGRNTLLAVLQRQATSAGARLHFGDRSTVEELGADLVIAADGVSSSTREKHQDQFGAEVDTGEGLYLWCGTDFALDSALFQPVATAHGTFVTHAYPYAPDRSTFLIETDERTWRRAGLDAATDATPFDQSDEQSLTYLREVFTDALQGHRLIGNRTRWMRFRTVRCNHWHSGNVVLLGDAAHTAHYSIGSGTKLAMEDAIALVASVRRADTLDTALSDYEAKRRPAVEHLQEVATRSQRWWDSFPRRMHLPINQLLVSYMTRAGKVPLEHFARSTPQVVARALEEYAHNPAVPGTPEGELDTDDILSWAVEQPLRKGGVATATRDDTTHLTVSDCEFVEDDPWGIKADAVVAAASTAGNSALRVTGTDDRNGVLDRLDFAERLRLEIGATVIVQAPARYLPDLAAGLVAGRVDLIDTTERTTGVGGDA
jgi:anthraniloyl-CoA monooxygenase